MLYILPHFKTPHIYCRCCIINHVMHINTTHDSILCIRIQETYKVSVWLFISWAFPLGHLKGCIGISLGVEARGVERSTVGITVLSTSKSD